MSERGLGRLQATALAISFVVGSGILVLPILSLEIAGITQSLYAWLMMTAIGIPLIAVFYQTTSIPGFTLTRAFTYSMGGATTFGARLTILAALLFGMPAMVHTTAAILSGFLGFGKMATILFSHLILTVFCLNHLRSLKKSTRLSIYTAAFLVILMVAAVALNPGDLKLGVQMTASLPPSFNLSFLEACSLAFFGYVGWESLGFFAAEVRSKRDLRFVFIASFVIVSLVYLALAATITGAATRGVSFSVNEGFLPLLPSGAIRIAASAIVVLLLLANINAWIFGGKTQMIEILGQGTSPKKALAIYYAITSSILLLLDLKKVTISELFLLCNQNWIVIYGGVLVFYFSRYKSAPERVIGGFGAVSFALLAMGCSKWMLLTGLFFVVSYLKHAVAARFTTPVKAF